MLHRGAVSTAEAGGEEEEQRQSCRQPAARQDAVLDISRSPRQHAVESLKGTGEDGGMLVSKISRSRTLKTKIRGEKVETSIIRRQKYQVPSIKIHL